jgi:1-aminocyclopropane-1-carboxylate deaminase/D-cysteine desulfhydrase-like pyridoxal-dependent ACC family enzyme
VRKLEFLLGEARARGCHRLATFGGTGSHHVAATAIHGRRSGFEVEAALFPQPLDDHVRELLLAEQACGARLTGISGYCGILPHLARALRSPHTYWLPGGGSSPLGSLGWVSGGFEILAQQHTGELPPLDAIYAALGSCGTIAGLLWSLRSPRALDLIGVRVVGAPTCGALPTRLLAHQLDRLLSPLRDPPRNPPPNLRIDRRFLGPAYGHPTPESLEAVAIAAHHGLTLDPIYTGKVLAALLSDARSGRLHHRRVLLLHSANTADLRPLTSRAPGPDHLPPRLRELFPC